MYIAFNKNIIVQDSPNGFYWRPNGLPFEQAQFLMLERNQIEKEIINYAGNGKEYTSIIEYFKKVKNQDVSELLQNLINLKILDSYESLPTLNIKGSRDFFYPIHCIFEITDACNLRCKHCFHGDTNTKTSHMNFENFKKTINILVNKGLRLVEITGGECTLHPNFIQFIDYLISVEQIELIAILTNGYGITEDFLNHIKEYTSRIVFGISLDSYKKEVHNNFRGNKDSFDNAVTAIKLLKKYGFKNRVGMVVYKENKYQIDETLNFAKSIGATIFSWNPLLNIGNAKKNENELFEQESKEQEIKFIQYQTDIFQKNQDYLKTVNPIFIKHMLENRDNCGFGTRSWTINNNGNIRPCTMMPDGLFKMGNIFRDDIDSIVKNPIFHLLNKSRSGGLSCKECQKCNSISNCSFCFFKSLLNALEHKDCSWFKTLEIHDIIENIDIEALKHSYSCSQSFLE